MATNIDVVWGAADQSKRDRLLTALAAEGFVPHPRDATDVDPSRPCVAIWEREDAAEGFGRLAELDEAARNGRLVSVLLEKTPLPAGLSPHPLVDLVNWRGSSENVSFADLVSTLTIAARDCKPVTIGGKISSRLRRLLAGFTVVAVLGFLLAFTMNVLAVQNNLCSIRFSQPNVSDMCGYLGLGGKPAREERLAWESRPMGSCDALRAHIERFPDGALRSTAADMLDGQRTIEEEDWVPDEQQLPLFVPIGGGFADRATAEADARERTRAQASQLCSGLAATDSYRLVSSPVSPDTWSCDTTTSGHYCGFDGVALCALERQVRTNRYLCGAAP